MDEFLGMKGAGRNVMTLLAEDGRVVRLMQYVDGSWSVLRDGKVCGIWEASEEDNCLKAFLRQSGRFEPITAVVFKSALHRETAPDPSLN
jgi:hypothetical protein